MSLTSQMRNVNKLAEVDFWSTSRSLTIMEQMLLHDLVQLAMETLLSSVELMIRRITIAHKLMLRVIGSDVHPIGGKIVDNVAPTVVPVWFESQELDLLTLFFQAQPR